MTITTQQVIIANAGRHPFVIAGPGAGRHRDAGRHLRRRRRPSWLSVLCQQRQEALITAQVDRRCWFITFVHRHLGPNIQTSICMMALVLYSVAHHHQRFYYRTADKGELPRTRLQLPLGSRLVHLLAQAAARWIVATAAALQLHPHHRHCMRCCGWRRVRSGRALSQIGIGKRGGCGGVAWSALRVYASAKLQHPAPCSCRRGA